MKKRKLLFEKKYKKVEELNEFLVYAYQPICKSTSELSLNRDHILRKLKKISLPSAFTLEKTYKVQGPNIIILYGSNLNLAKLKYLENFKVLGIKVQNFMYSYELVKHTFVYPNASSFCYTLSNTFLNKLATLVILLQSKENKIN